MANITLFNLQKFVKTFLERGLSIATYIFPFLEITFYFSNRVCYSCSDIQLKAIYANVFYPLILVYEKYVYLIFIIMVGIFFICSRGLVPLTKFLRFNVLQAILLNILCACIGQIYMASPTFLKLSIFGTMFANFIYIGTICWIGYSIIIISLGRFPILPIISRAANIHLRR